MNRYDVQHKGVWMVSFFMKDIYEAHAAAKAIYGLGCCTTGVIDR